MKVYILSILMFSSISSVSQHPLFGFDLGFNLSRGQYQPDEGIDRRILGGFDGGILMQIPVKGNFELQPQLSYVINGVELNDGVNENSIKLQYFSISILARVKLGELSLLFGPAHSILLGAWNDPSGGGPSTPIKGHFKFTDLVGTVGLQYAFSRNVFMSVRYNHGFEQIVEDAVGFTMRNRYLSFKIGYVIE